MLSTHTHTRGVKTLEGGVEETGHAELGTVCMRVSLVLCWCNTSKYPDCTSTPGGGGTVILGTC